MELVEAAGDVSFTPNRDWIVDFPEVGVGTEPIAT
jgi:hypothetical protein